MIQGTVLMVNKFVYHRGGAEDYMLALAEMLEHEGAQTLYFGMQFDRNLPVDTSRFFPSSWC